MTRKELERRLKPLKLPRGTGHMTLGELWAELTEARAEVRRLKREKDALVEATHEALGQALTVGMAHAAWHGEVGKPLPSNAHARLVVAAQTALSRRPVKAKRPPTKWNGMCPAGKHGLDHRGQTCDLCERPATPKARAKGRAR